MGLEGVGIEINETEPVVARAVPYFKKLLTVLQKYPKRYAYSSFSVHALLTQVDE